MLIGLSGLIGSGKSTVSKYLVEEKGFLEFTFSTALKDIVSILFNWNRDLLEGTTIESREFRETVDTYWSKKLDIPDFTPRKALTLIGTDLFREKFNENTWINIIEKKVLDNIDKDIVVSDCRYINELETIKKSGGFTINIIRPPLPLWYKKVKNNEKVEGIHSSETEHINYSFDFTIINDKDINSLIEKVEKLLEETNANKTVRNFS